MNITKDIKYVGVKDDTTDLFEGQYSIPCGITYNSYVIDDDKCAVMDSVDAAFGDEWIANVRAAIGDRVPDYLVVHHMEPDHSASILRFVREYPETKIVSSRAAFVMMRNYFGDGFDGRQIVVTEGSTLELGRHTLKFLAAPMVHWPEVVMSYDTADGVLFSADGFGRFGNFDEDEQWRDEARRYYIGIVGKYGKQVEAVLAKAASLDIKIIAPLHGPVLTKNLHEYIDLYAKWASYTPEELGTTVAYASVYGNTGRAAKALADELRSRGERVELFDLSRCDIHEAVASAFRFDKLVLASTTYNADVFPAMKHYILGLVERGFTARVVGLIENGSWAPRAATVMRELLKDTGVTFTETTVKITCAPSSQTNEAISALADELCK